jgi:hypothetical protein
MCTREAGVRSGGGDGGAGDGAGESALAAYLRGINGTPVVHEVCVVRVCRMC